VFDPVCLGGMTIGTQRSAIGGEEIGTVSGEGENGPWAILFYQAKALPPAPFPFSYSFPFSYCWFYLKTLQMKPYLIQTNFELCKIQISLCCLSKGKDFVLEKVKTFGTQMHMIKKYGCMCIR
jgi:hypothetical protein